VDDVPDGDDWIFEVKFDGYRAISAVRGEKARIFTRGGLDWTSHFPSVARALSRLDLDGALLDGEIVAIDEQGRNDFGALQNALNTSASLSYFVFDLLELEGKSLRRLPLVERKEKLRDVLGDAGRKGPIFFVDHVERNGTGMLASLCDKGYEGIIGKRANQAYRSGRSKSWLKIKCGHEQEFVIFGWSDSTRDRPFSSLVLGLREGGGYRYAGRVGSGFSDRDLQRLSKRFHETRKKPALMDVPRTIERKAHWVKPELVAEVAFAGFTKDGIVRQGRFLGLREDKPARKVTREKPIPVEEVE
jgi:bifunctional non-homologous end joining protein LigD